MFHLFTSPTFVYMHWIYYGWLIDNSVSGNVIMWIYWRENKHSHTHYSSTRQLHADHVCCKLNMQHNSPNGSGSNKQKKLEDGITVLCVTHSHRADCSFHFGFIPLLLWLQEVVSLACHSFFLFSSLFVGSRQSSSFSLLFSSFCWWLFFLYNVRDAST